MYPLEYPLDELMVEHLLARGRGGEVHGCGLVTPSGHGVLFVGQSGAGKTTTARLWEGAPGVRILSDDRLILREEGVGIRMYGTPWHGEGRFAAPESVPLARVFFLRQGPENRLRPVSRAAAVARLVACGFMPFYDPAALDFTLAFFSGVAERVSCSELEFTPDERAVRCVEAELA